MRHSEADLTQFLEELARHAKPAERLPTVRHLMREFGLSQAVIQRALQGLKDRGLIESQVGRGTFFAGRPPDGAVGRPAARTAEPTLAKTRSVLLLRRSVSIARGRRLLEGLQARLAADGHRVLEVSYTDPDHARAVLNALPYLDACVLQSSYRTIPIDLLAGLKSKCAVVAIDGMALAGSDVEAVGTEWGEPLGQAVARLQAAGHRRIAFAATSQPLVATCLGWRRFEQLQSAKAGLEMLALRLPLLPDEDYAGMLAEQIVASRDASGHLPFTALVAWGIEDGEAFRRLLAAAGLSIPEQLSVVLLGRTDMANEHADFFDVIGSSVADQIDAMHEAIRARWNSAGASHGVTFTPLARRDGRSVAGPPVERTAARKPARRTLEPSDSR